MIIFPIIFLPSALETNNNKSACPWQGPWGGESWEKTGQSHSCPADQNQVVWHRTIRVSGGSLSFLSSPSQYVLSMGVAGGQEILQEK